MVEAGDGPELLLSLVRADGSRLSLLLGTGGGGVSGRSSGGRTGAVIGNPAATPAALEGVNGKIITSEQKLRRVDEIFPGAGANITNLSRFSDWERWGYDWRLDEPTLLAIAPLPAGFADVLRQADW